jgi:general secretion pathway protein G
MARFSPRHRQLGATLAEMVTITCLLLIFIWIAAEKIWELRVAAERTHVIAMIGKLQSALGLEVAERALEQGIPAVVALQGSNPMDLLQPPPSNYAGEKQDLDPAVEKGGRWYFDLDARELVYRVEFEENFRSSLAGPARIRLALQVSYRDLNNDGRYDPGRDQLRNVSLKQLDQYRWIPVK